jgi:hypothetical protein
LCLFAAPVFASSINITIRDGYGSSSDPWYSGNIEDQETEPGTIASQAWDLERFSIDGTRLTMTGGYDFKNGNSGVLAGDIFVAVNRQPVFGPTAGLISNSSGIPNPIISNAYNYNYVYNINWSNGSYSLYSINKDSQVYGVEYSATQDSNPWRYASGGTLIGTGSILYETGLTDVQTGLSGGLHNSVTVDLDKILGAGYQTFYVHNTMQCGNDNLMGEYADPVPESSTLVLFGMGIAGLSIYGKKQYKQAKCRN